jgi:hypothetical protein
MAEVVQALGRGGQRLAESILGWNRKTIRKGALENRWRGEIIDTTQKGLGLARSMTYKGIKPTVRKVTKVYRRGSSVVKKAMRDIERRLERKPGLESWFIKIIPQPRTG